jgi:hypothetical protein
MARRPFLLCEVHGLVNDSGSSGILIEDSIGVTLEGNLGQCFCGRPAPYVDGTYDVVNDRMTARLRLSSRQIFQLRAVLRKAEEAATEEAQRASALQMEATLRDTVPEISGVLDKIGSPASMGFAAWLSVLMAVVTLIVTFGSQGIDQGELEQIVEQTVSRMLLEQQEDSQPITPPPAIEIPPPNTH